MQAFHCEHPPSKAHKSLHTPLSLVQPQILLRAANSNNFHTTTCLEAGNLVLICILGHSPSIIDHSPSSPIIYPSQCSLWRILPASLLTLWLSISGRQASMIHGRYSRLPRKASRIRSDAWKSLAIFEDRCAQFRGGRNFTHRNDRILR